MGKAQVKAKRGDFFQHLPWETKKTVNDLKCLGHLLKIKFTFIRIESSDKKLGFNKRISVFVSRSAGKVGLAPLTCYFMLISYLQAAPESCQSIKIMAVNYDSLGFLSSGDTRSYSWQDAAERND